MTVENSRSLMCNFMIRRLVLFYSRQILIGGMQAFRSAGVSPAVFVISRHRKDAGGTPALQYLLRHAHLVVWLP
jgi:hypothetical protein